MADFDGDLKELRAEMTQIRSDLAALATTLRDLAKSGKAEIGEQAHASAEHLKDAALKTKDKLAQEIHDNPLTSALTIFGVGIALGAILSPRHS